MPKTALERVFVWLGGGAFVASLALCAYTFMVTWSRVEATHPLGAECAIVLDVMWLTVFAAHHSLFARDRVKAWISTTIAARLVRSVYVWTASLLFAAVMLAWQPIGGELYHSTGWLRYGHALVQLLGAWLIARSVRVIDALELAGIRSTDKVAVLQTTGPYRLVRHPLYLGWMLIVFGAAQMTGDRAAFAATTTAYLIVAMPWEERSLGRIFGQEYARYKQQVPWRVIPLVY